MFGKKNKENKTVFVSLSYRYISIAYEDNSELKTDNYEFEIQEDIKDLTKIWNKGIKKLLSKFPFKPKIILLFNSSSFWVKNIQDIENDNDRYQYVSKQLGVPRSSFEMTHIKNISYLVIEDSAIKDTLFTFKNYHVKSIYDISVVNGLYFLSQSSELYINISLASVDIILNGKLFQKRSNKKLFLSYLQKSAKRLNLDLDSIYTYLRKNFDDIESYEELTKSTKNGATELREFIDELIEYAESTLGYFNNYEDFKEIGTIYLDGDILELSFIAIMLRNILEIQIIPTTEPLNLNDYKNVTTTVAYHQLTNGTLKNLTISLNGLRYNDGKQEFIFIDNGLVSRKKLTKEQKRKVITFKRVQDIHMNKGDIESQQVENKSIWAADISEIPALLGKKLFSRNNNEEEIEEFEDFDDNKETKKEKVQILFLIFLIAFAIIYYFVIPFFNGIKNDFQREVSIYGKVIKNFKETREKIAEERGLIIGDDIDKILWTEKLITISNRIPETIWFSSIRLDKYKKKDSYQILIEGRALPSSDGHIKIIAKYMEKLLKSDKNFQKDFVDVIFEGAKQVDEMGQNLIGFKLYCNFQKDIHKKEIEEKEKKR